MKKRTKFKEEKYEVVLEFGKTKKKTIIVGEIDGKELNRHRFLSVSLRSKE